MTRQPNRTHRTLSKDAVRKAVASSTAIETGECSSVIEDRLKAGKRRFPKLTLAN